MADPISILIADLLHPYNLTKTFPYAAGCVGAYVASALGEQVSVEVFRAPEDLGAAFRRQPPRILAFSNYIWNLQLSYAVVEKAKAAAPETIVVVGGPNYPTHHDAQKSFLERYSLIDFYVYKEGEIPFTRLIEQLRDEGFDAAKLKRARPHLAAVHYLSGGEFVAPPPSPRQRNLDEFPSPYLSGLLDKFFERHDLTPLIQTKRGCPFQCTFCVEGEDYYSKLASATTDRLRAEIEYVAKRMRGGSPVLHVADSNFGMYAQDLEICDLIAAARDRHGWPQTIEVSTGKNRKERVLEAVRRSRGLIRFGPALQSTDPVTLEAIKRSNISERILMDMASAAMEMGQRSYTELILGLPGDTVEGHLQSIRAAMEAGMQRIKMYPLVLLPGTEMATPEARREHQLETRFRVLPQCHGTYRFTGDPFPSVEIIELVVSTKSMTSEQYMRCKRFELSVEIFYNDAYLQEIHGLTRALGLSMFEFVDRCHALFDTYPDDLKRLYGALEHGVRGPLWESLDGCIEHYRDPDNLERYAREEYKGSLGILKALALLEHIEALLEIARTALLECVAAAGIERPSLAEYVDELIEYSRLRRLHILDSALRPEGEFRFAFDQILEREFRVDPERFRLPRPRRMRFWHDEEQARDIRSLCAETSNPLLRARSFIYPQTDPGVNPYLRKSEFC